MRPPILLPRPDWKAAVHDRDRQRCVVCAAARGGALPGGQSLPAGAVAWEDLGAGLSGTAGHAADGTPLDAHHLLERRLWPDGGYYVANGVSLCPPHHFMAEETRLAVEDLRAAAGISDVLLPPQFDDGTRLDKWGNEILANGQRLRGELFDDAAVQKVLGAAGVLAVFTDRVKYPKTFHVPFSPGLTTGDKVIPDLSAFLGRRGIVTVKMDGENTTWGLDYMHARSLDSRHHPSRDYVKAMHAALRHEIPEGWRICGENLFALHSIAYGHLRSFFQVFAIFDERNYSLAWDDVVAYCEMLGLATVPVLYDGVVEEDVLRELYRPTYQGDPMEGWVLRIADRYHYRDHRRYAAKFVRAGHVQTDQHWSHQAVVPNKLANP